MSKPPSKRPKRVVARNFILFRTNPGFKFPVDGEVYEEVANTPENAAKGITEIDWVSFKDEIAEGEGLYWAVIDLEAGEVFKVEVTIREIKEIHFEARVVK